MLLISCIDELILIDVITSIKAGDLLVCWSGADRSGITYCQGGKTLTWLKTLHILHQFCAFLTNARDYREGSQKHIFIQYLGVSQIGALTTGIFSSKDIMHVLQQLCFLTDLKARQFEIACHSDVGDDVHTNTVRKLDFLSIRKLHFKHISRQLYLNLKKWKSALFFNKKYHK